MNDFSLTIVVRDVAEGDATTLAQAIVDEHGEAFDASLGDFDVSVARMDDGHAFDIGWEPGA